MLPKLIKILKTTILAAEAQDEKGISDNLEKAKRIVKNYDDMWRTAEESPLEHAGCYKIHAYPKRGELQVLAHACHGYTKGRCEYCDTEAANHQSSKEAVEDLLQQSMTLEIDSLKFSYSIEINWRGPQGYIFIPPELSKLAGQLNATTTLCFNE